MCAAALVVAAAALLAQTRRRHAQAPSTQTPPAQPQPPDLPTPRFRTEADVVVVEATVLDRKGVIVSGLGAADFKVEIGGKPREIVSVDLVEYAPPSTEAETAAGDPEITTNEPKENGRVVLLVIDQASLSSDARAMIGSAQKWVRSMPAKDLIGLLTFPAPGPSVDFTADHAKVAEALTRVVGVGSTAPPFQQYNISIWEAIRMDSQDMFVRADVIGRECRGNAPLCATEVEMQTKTMIQDAQSHIQPVLRSLRATMRGLARVPGPKHAVLLSSGWAMNERDASTEMGWVAADAARANVTIHTFTAEMWALAASRSRPSMRSIEDRNLLMNNVEMLASMTGGRSVRLTGQADTAFASLSQGLSGYYRLGVQALPEDLDGKDHRINLKVSRPGASLASYRRVLSGTRPEGDAPTDPETALRAALKGGPLRTGVDLRATSYVLHATTSARDLRVVAVGDVNRAAPGRAKAVAALYDFDGKPVTAMENTVEVGADGPGVLSVELTAPPGTYVLRVAVLDAQGRIGSLERLVDARWKKTGGIETPGLVLFRSDRSTRSAPRPVFDGVTTADEVTAQLALSGAIADKKPTVVFEVARVGSTAPLVRRTGRIAQTTGGTTVAQETLPASMLPPGRYTLSAKIGTGGASLSRTFTVSASATVGPAPTAAGGTAPAASGVPAAASGGGGHARAGTLSFAKPRFATSTVLDAAFVTPLIDWLAARPDTASVREAIEQSKAGPWPTDSARGPLAAGAARRELRRRARTAPGRRSRRGGTGVPRRAQGGARLRAGPHLPRRLLCRRRQGSGSRRRVADGARPRAHVARTAAARDRSVAARRQAGGGAGAAQSGPPALAGGRRVRSPAGAGRARRRAAAGRARSRRADQAARPADAAAGADRALRCVPPQDAGMGRCPRSRDDAPPAGFVRRAPGRLARARRCLAGRDGAGVAPLRARSKESCCRERPRRMECHCRCRRRVRGRDGAGTGAAAVPDRRRHRRGRGDGPRL